MFTVFTLAKRASISLSVLSLIPILNGNFNNNYQLPLKRLYGKGIFKNHNFRKLSLEKKMRTSYKSIKIEHNKI
jgi:hypothetical protein